MRDLHLQLSLMSSPLDNWPKKAVVSSPKPIYPAGSNFYQPLHFSSRALCLWLCRGGRERMGLIHSIISSICV